MACVMTGGGATLTFGSVTNIGRLRNIGVYTEAGSTVDNTDLSDAYVKMCPGDLTDFGSIDCTVLWDDLASAGWRETPAFDIHTKGTLTIVFQNGNEIAAEAFVLTKSVGDHVNNQEVIANYTFYWTADASVPSIAVGTPPT